MPIVAVKALGTAEVPRRNIVVRDDNCFNPDIMPTAAESNFSTETTG